MNRLKLARAMSGIIWHGVVISGALVFAVPFVWMVSTSLKEQSQIFAFPPQFIPRPVMWQNYAEALLRQPFGLYTLNTTWVTLTGMVGHLASCSLVAFGFARLRFPGRNVLFLLVLSTLMVPVYVVMIPNFVLFRMLGWVDTFWPLIAPAFFATNPVYIFLLRQYFLSIPREIDEAARLDGCSTWRVYAEIILPMSTPALGAVAIMIFVARWNWFLEPLIYIHHQERYLLSIGLSFFRGEHGSLWHLLMAASTVTMLPCLALFFFFQRMFIQGIVITGVKG